MIVEELAEEWRKSGVCRGDILMIHSSLRRTLQKYQAQDKEISPQIVLESFIEAVGSLGTLLFPLFNYDFTKGIPFDIRHTPSQMGALSEMARLYPRAIRTEHPICSFAVIGAESKRFEHINNYSGWGKDSPFATILEMDGKVALLDCLNATMIHHAEEMCEVPYRYHKDFTGKYTDINGETSERTYSFFVRDIENGVINHLYPIKDLLVESGIYKGGQTNSGNFLKVGSARDIFDFVTEVIKSGNTENMFYRIEGKDYE
jgi:aminoglycoside 3-N-acetyltransferase